MQSETKRQTINEARRSANRFAKAKTMTSEGYTWEAATLEGQPLADTFHVRTPEGRIHTCNLASPCCTCEDYKKHREPCKHYFWLQREMEAQEMAACEAVAAEYEAEKTRLQSGLIPQLLPAPYDVEETDKPVLTVAMVLEALQARIVQDMDRAEALMLKRDIQCFAVKIDRIRRFEHLQGALHVINDYWTKERANLLDLTPAETVTL